MVVDIFLRSYRALRPWRTSSYNLLSLSHTAVRTRRFEQEGSGVEDVYQINEPFLLVAALLRKSSSTPLENPLIDWRLCSSRLQYHARPARDGMSPFCRKCASKFPRTSLRVFSPHQRCTNLHAIKLHSLNRLSTPSIALHRSEDQ
jgi:hypothetical protein